MSLCRLSGLTSQQAEPLFEVEVFRVQRGVLAEGAPNVKQFQSGQLVVGWCARFHIFCKSFKRLLRESLRPARLVVGGTAQIGVLGQVEHALRAFLVPVEAIL